MYADTITLFNRYESRLGDTWYPTVLHGVDLNVDRASIIAKYGEGSADNAILHIKYSVADGVKTVGGKKYLPPKEWDKQTNDLLPDSLTFTSGQAFDFFYAGEWPSADPISDDSYLDGFYDYMSSRYDYVYAITSVAEYSVIPHFEIMAK